MELWKVRGEVNPADLFTKHLESEDRITALLKLFGCRFMSGRAESAPRIREACEPVLTTGVDKLERFPTAAEMRYDLDRKAVVYDGYSYPAVRLEDSEKWVPDAFLHQAGVLPHLIEGDSRQLFPQVQPAEDPEIGMPEQADWLEQRAIDEGLVNSPVCMLSTCGFTSPRVLSGDSCRIASAYR